MSSVIIGGDGVVLHRRSTGGFEGVGEYSAAVRIGKERAIAEAAADGDVDEMVGRQ